MARGFARWWFIGSVATLAMLVILAAKTARERGWNGYLRLIQNGVSCEAIVTKTEQQGSCRAEYSFSIKGHDYFGAGPDCSARVGQKVIITYLVDDPARSCLGHAGARLADEIASFLFGGLSFPPLS
jgi:hypothetical protein